MRRFLPEASSGFRWPYRLLDDFAVCSMVPLVYDSVFFCMVSFLLDEDAASIHGIYCWQRVYNRTRFLYELDLFSIQASNIKKHHHRCFMCMCVCVCVHVFTWSTSPFISLYRKKQLSYAKGVSSIVGAPCNEVSLCNRAGWLGFGRKQSIG